MNAVPVPDEAASMRRGLRRLQRLARYVRPYWKRATVGIVAMLVATGAGPRRPVPREARHRRRDRARAT